MPEPSAGVGEKPRPVRRELYVKFLTRVLPPQPGVCVTCRQGTDNLRNCDACIQVLRTLGLGVVRVLPMALRLPRTQLRNMTFQYKDPSLDSENRKNAQYALSTFAGRFLLAHEACLAAEAGLGRFDIVTWVPASAVNARSNSPVEDLLRGSPWAARAGNADRLVSTLHDPGRVGTTREPRVDRYDVLQDVRGRRVLLVDDTWTRGGHALSGVRALLDAGAESVAVCVIGRHFDPGYSAATEAYFREASRIGFEASRCAICDPRGPADPPLVPV